MAGNITIGNMTSLDAGNVTSTLLVPVVKPGTLTNYHTQLGNLTAAVGSELVVTDGTHTVDNVTTLNFSGATVGGVSPEGNVTIAAAGIEITDGTHDVTGATKLTVTGGTVGGTTPNATLTVAGSTFQGFETATDFAIGPGGPTDPGTPHYSVFVGGSAGGTAQTGANSNTGVGYQALEGLTEGGYNVALGDAALRACTTGARNIGIGTYALVELTSGSANTAIGEGAGQSITTEDGNTLVGAGATMNAGGQSYGTAVGSAAQTSDSGVAVGNGATAGSSSIAIGGGTDAKATGSLVIGAGANDGGIAGTLNIGGEITGVIGGAAGINVGTAGPILNKSVPVTGVDAQTAVAGAAASDAPHVFVISEDLIAATSYTLTLADAVISSGSVVQVTAFDGTSAWGVTSITVSTESVVIALANLGSPLTGPVSINVSIFN